MQVDLERRFGDPSLELMNLAEEIERFTWFPHEPTAALGRPNSAR